MLKSKHKKNSIMAKAERAKRLNSFVVTGLCLFVLGCLAWPLTVRDFRSVASINVAVSKDDHSKTQLEQALARFIREETTDERLEAIVRQGKVDFIALCRPLICEPDLPNRWLAGRGSSTAACISCNSCIYAMIVHPGRPEPGVVTCVYKHDQPQHRMAQRWLAAWVSKNAQPPAG